MLVQPPLSRGTKRTKTKLRCGKTIAVARLCLAVVFIVVMQAVSWTWTDFDEKTSSLQDQAGVQSGVPVHSIVGPLVGVPEPSDNIRFPANSSTPDFEGSIEEKSTSKLRKKQLEKQRQRGPKTWKNCSLIIDGLDLVNVVEPPEAIEDLESDGSKKINSKILCFIMTNSRRQSRIKAVLDTWGKRCDHMLVASDTTDPLIGSIGMRTPATYEELFNKLNETIKYVWDTFYDSRDSSTSINATEYDWVVKADDDSYIVVENLRYFLDSPEVQAKHQQGEPLIYGRIFAWPMFEDLNRLPGYFSRKDTHNHEFGRRFLQRVNRSDTLKYHSGGAAYVMNKEYLRILLNTFQSADTLRGIPDEDTAIGINMLYQGIHPQPTRDKQGRERFHPEPPDSMYHLYNGTSKWLYDFHKLIGGIDYGPQCCSPTSISFHHIKPLIMRVMDYQLYKCRDERRERQQRFAEHPIPRKLDVGPRVHAR